MRAGPGSAPAAPLSRLQRSRDGGMRAERPGGRFRSPCSCTWPPRRPAWASSPSCSSRYSRPGRSTGSGAGGATTELLALAGMGGVPSGCRRAGGLGTLIPWAIEAVGVRGRTGPGDDQAGRETDREDDGLGCGLNEEDEAERAHEDDRPDEQRNLGSPGISDLTPPPACERAARNGLRRDGRSRPAGEGYRLAAVAPTSFRPRPTTRNT